MQGMAILQKGALWIIILGFLAIIGREMFFRFKEQTAIRKAEFNKKMKELEGGNK